MKSQIAKMLELLCDRMTGFLTSFTYFTFNLLENNLDKLSIESNPSYIDPLVISLDFLSILSYSICKREDLLDYVEEIFLKNQAYFSLMCPSNLLKNKLFLFYGFYLDCLFQKSELNEVYLARLSELIHAQKNNPEEVVLQAWDSLNEIIINKGFKSRNVGNLELILLEFIQDLDEKNEIIYYESLQELIRMYNENKFGKIEVMLMVFQNILDKMQKINLKNKILFRILKEILKENVETFKNNIGILWKLLYEAFCKGKEDVDNEIMDIICSLVDYKLEKSLFMETVSTYLKKNGKLGKELVIFINSFLFFSRNISIVEECFDFIKKITFNFLDILDLTLPNPIYLIILLISILQVNKMTDFFLIFF